MELNERLTQLSEILVALTATPIPSQQFQLLADYSSLVLPFDFLAICLVDADQQGYWVHPLVGQPAKISITRLFSVTEGIVGQVIRHNRRQVTENLHQHPAATADLEGSFNLSGWDAALVVPLRQEENVLGALYFAARPPQQYQAEDVQIANLLAAGLSAALANTRLYQALADERSTLAAVLRSTQDAVVMVNNQGTILLLNPAAGKKLGVEPVTAVGHPLTQVIQNGPLLELFTHPQNQIVEITLPDASIAQVELVQVESDYGELIGWAAILRDITLLKQLEQMKNEFVNTVSHDLKNPISTIQLAADLLPQAGNLNEQQHNIQQRITETAVYMNELVTDLLDLGKIEARFDMEITPLDITQLTQEVIQNLLPSAEKKTQHLGSHLPAAFLVLGNRNRLRQVLANLIGNSIKYTPPGGTIRVDITRETEQALIRIQDNGIGIPPADLPFVFDKFYRVRNEHTRYIKGTGLGLAISKSIIEASNGRIWAESTPGNGSTFLFTLPLA